MLSRSDSKREENFFFATASRTAMATPSHLTPPSAGVKSGSESDHPLLSNVEDNDPLSYTFTPPYVLN
jgi:hypothetical protein